VTNGRAFIRLVRTVKFGQFTAGPQRRVIDRLEDVSVQLLCLLALKRQTYHEERVGKTLNADANWPMTLVALFRLNRHTNRHLKVNQ